MNSPFACDMTAIPAAERGGHHELIQRLMFDALQDVSELPDGLAFRFPGEEYDSVAQFVSRERLCCPFLGFTLDVSPDHGPVWLRLTGAAGVNDFLRAELGLPEPPPPRAG